MVKTVIADGTGTGRQALVTENYALKVQAVPETSKGLPPEDLSNLRQLRQYLLNGTSPDMNVNGSVTNVDFIINSTPGVTQWVTGMRILLEDASMEINTSDFRRFGTASVGLLPNGVQILTVQSGETILISNEPIRSIGDFLRYADAFVNLVNSVGAQDDYLHFDIEFDKPIVLASGGADSIIIRIRDNLTAVNSFRCIVRGYKESIL